MVGELAENDVLSEISLIDEIAARYAVEPLLDSDVTIRRMVEKTGLGKTRCEAILAKEVEAGRLVEVVVLTDGNRRTRAWRKP